MSYLMNFKTFTRGAILAERLSRTALVHSDPYLTSVKLSSTTGTTVVHLIMSRDRAYIKDEALLKNSLTAELGPHFACNKYVDTPEIFIKKSLDRNFSQVVTGEPREVLMRARRVLKFLTNNASVKAALITVSGKLYGTRRVVKSFETEEKYQRTGIAKHRLVLRYTAVGKMGATGIVCRILITENMAKYKVIPK